MQQNGQKEGKLYQQYSFLGERVYKIRAVFS